MNPCDLHLSLPSFACLTALGLSLLAVVSPAQSPDSGGQCDPDVKALLTRVDTARGKPEQQPFSLAIEGTFVVNFAGAATDEPVAKGTFRDVFLGKDQARHVSDMGSYGNMQRGTTKDLAWEVDPMHGGKVYQGVHAATVRRYFGILRGASATELYESIARAGTQEIDGREHIVLRMMPALGKADMWYVDAKNATVSRVDMALPAPESNDPAGEDAMDAELTFTDWKLENGMRYPHQRALKMGPATVSFVCTKVRIGAALEPKQFTPPEAITKLEVTPAQPHKDASGQPSYQIVDKKAQPVASIRLKCKPAEISATLATVLPEIMGHLNATGAKMAGAPFSRYHSMGEEIDLEAGIPVAQPIVEKGRIENGELPAGRVITVWHVGPYDQLGRAHESLQAYAAKEKLVARGGPWEVYWTDPGMVTDPAKWRTQLFLPIQ